MFKLSKSYFISALLTAFMTTCACAQNLPAAKSPPETVAVGDSFPHFQLTDTQYQSIDLYDYFQKQPVVLIYYRGGW